MGVKKILVYYNNEKKKAFDLAKKIKSLLASKGVRCEQFPSVSARMPSGDFAVALGGDGTMLKVSHMLAGTNIPLLGINMGSLGFLAEADPNELYQVINHILTGHLLVNRRMLLEASVLKKGTDSDKSKRYLAFNDCVIRSGEESRVVSISVYVNKELLSTFPGDGVIVSTPTGSTAYSLAAGGPIVYPALDLFIISPICPHMLTQRPVILPEGSIIELCANPSTRKRKVVLSLDGQREVPLGENDTVRIKKSGKSILIATLPKKHYFEILRKKLNWGER